MLIEMSYFVFIYFVLVIILENVEISQQNFSLCWGTSIVDTNKIGSSFHPFSGLLLIWQQQAATKSHFQIGRKF